MAVFTATVFFLAGKTVAVKTDMKRLGNGNDKIKPSASRVISLLLAGRNL